MLSGAEREFTDAHIDSRQCDLFRIHNNATLVRPACNPYILQVVRRWTTVDAGTPSATNSRRDIRRQRLGGGLAESWKA